MRQMNRMMSSMNSIFNQPFGGFLEPGMGSELMPFGGRSMGSGLMPFGFPNMNNLFQNMEQMTNNPNCHSYSSSTVMTMTNGPDGRPQVSSVLKYRIAGYSFSLSIFFKFLMYFVHDVWYVASLVYFCTKYVFCYLEFINYYHIF